MNKKILKIALLCGGLMSIADNASATEWPTVIKPNITSTKVFNITDYGATTSSKNNTTAIQKALDACGTAGGGKVIIPAGTFLCGPIKMSSNTNLYISKNAVLQLLPYGHGNGVDADSYPNNGTKNNYANFIEAKTTNAINLMISGQGTIYGNGDAWWTAYDDSTAANISMKRGALIRFMKCSQIEIDSITLKDAPGSHITIGSGGNAHDATIQNVTINTKVPSHNTDGIDTWGYNINIDNCYISDGDDNIAIDKGSQYIKITNCTFGNGHGTSVGSYTSNVKHVFIDHCTYTGTDNGIRLKSNTDRGGGEEDFTFSNLTMTGVKYTLYIDDYYDKQYTTPAKDKANKKDSIATTPSFKDIYLKNITSTAASKYNTIFIYGRPECHVKNITFDNVTVTSTKGMIINFADNVRFINGSRIYVNGATNAIASQYDAQIFDECNATPVKSVTADTTTGRANIYSLDGRIVKRNATEEDMNSMHRGMYIYDNKTIAVR